MRAQISSHDYEQLSAYLDGQLASGERTKLESRLKTRPDLQSALEDLRQTRSLLRMAPRKRAPRNFTLTPAMVGQGSRARQEKRGWGGFQLFPALGFASAMAALLLVVVILLDFGPLGGMRTAQSTAREGAPAAAMLQATQPVENPAAAGAGVQKSTGAASNGTGMTAESMPQATQEPSPQPPAVAQGAAPAAKSSIPGGPINWQLMGRGGGDGGMGGGLGGGPAGGAVDSGAVVAQQLGLRGSPDGSLPVPAEGLQSLEANSAQLSTEQPVQPAQPNPDITGSGPILGVPAAGEAGKVFESQSDVGHPELVTPAPTSAPALKPEAQPATSLSDQPYPAPRANPVEPAPWYAREIAGLPALRLIEGGLLVIALLTGITAWILWRQRS